VTDQPTGRTARWITWTVLAVVLAGCGGVSIPGDLRTPSVAGVVDEVTRLPDGGVTYRLANGKTAEIASQRDILLGGDPLVGELLLAGTDPDGSQWVAGVSLSNAPDRPPGCFLVPGRGRLNADWIETTGGFRLPKAAAFRDARARPEDDFASDQGVFCLNEDGEVTSYDIR
jgi:hypothetical protein